MQIKRFEAKNMTEALQLIKRDLGSEAVILSAKDLRRENRLLGISRKIGVEVTAAIDEVNAGVPPARKAARNGEPGDGRRSDTIGGMAPKSPHKGLLHNIYDKVNLRGAAARSTGHPAAADLQHPPTADGAAGRKADADASQSTGLRLKTDADNGSIDRYLSNSGLSVSTLKLEKERTNLVALVGNAGVGKTTTIAKLAAHYKYVRKENVGLLALDRRRIGGLEQLRIYADSMGLPLASIEHKGDLPAALAQLQACGLILIDCPAIDPPDLKGPASLQSRFAALGGVQTLLTVSAESREEDLQDTAMRYAALKPAGVAITKTDLTSSYRDMINFLCRQGLPVLYVCSGPRVPFDLTQATIAVLGDRFVQQRSPGASGTGYTDAEALSDVWDSGDPGPSVYLANKSSDIFHRPECKWIRLINKANVVEFNSFAEALNHRFKPCRYCNPQHLSITGMLSRESAAR